MAQQDRESEQKLKQCSTPKVAQSTVGCTATVILPLFYTFAQNVLALA